MSHPSIETDYRDNLENYSPIYYSVVFDGGTFWHWLHYNKLKVQGALFLMSGAIRFLFTGKFHPSAQAWSDSLYQCKTKVHAVNVS